MSIQLPFGKKEEKLIHISDVESGLQCGCVCPSCEAPLIARKGQKTAHHFAHYKTKSCSTAVETALHWSAKNILAESLKICLPATEVHFNTFRKPFELVKSDYLHFDDVHLEQPLDDTVPDVLLEKKGRKLALEIKVSHEVDEEKADYLKKRGISVLEIDLSKEPRDITPSNLQDIIVDEIENKEWIHNQRARQYHDRLIQASRRKMILETGMDMFVNECPARYREEEGEYYALVIDDCWHCRYCMHHERQEGVIFCGG